MKGAFSAVKAFVFLHGRLDVLPWAWPLVIGLGHLTKPPTSFAGSLARFGVPFYVTPRVLVDLASFAGTTTSLSDTICSSATVFEETVIHWSLLAPGGFGDPFG